VELREEHASEEAGEQREQDHPDQRGGRAAEDEVDPSLLVVPDHEGDQVRHDQDEDGERDPEARLPGALELLLAILHGRSLGGGGSEHGGGAGDEPRL